MAQTSSPQHTPGMNDWCCVQSIIYSLWVLCGAFVFWKKKGVSVSTFNFVVIVYWYIHEVAAVKAERTALFWFCEDICPHCFGRAISDFYISIGDFVMDEVVSAFYVFCAFGA